MTKILSALFISMCLSPAAHAATNLSDIVAQMAAAASPIAATVQFNAAGVEVSKRDATVTATDVDGLFRSEDGYSIIDWSNGALKTEVDPVGMPRDLRDVSRNLDWAALANTLSAIPEFADPSTPTSSKLLFVTSIAYTRGVQYNTIPGIPLLQDPVKAALAKLSPTAVVAVVSIADPELAKQCDKQPSPYWVIDLATGKTVTKGTDNACAPIPPGGVSSSGQAD